MSSAFKAAVIQAASIPGDTVAAARKAAALIHEAAAQGARVLVFPEAFLGGYPKGNTFGAPVGLRTPQGRDAYARYWQQAVRLDDEAVALVAEAAAATATVVVMGCIEAEGAPQGGTLYCTALYFNGARGLVGKHRKLMPTAAERLIWGFGDGSTMQVVETEYGRIGAVICWENYMPMLRMCMYSQGVALYCAPTADDRDSWLPSMRHIALEGRCYVLTACQHLRRSAWGPEFECVLADGPAHAPDTVLMRGGSAIIGPLGEVLAGPDFAGETILTADIDLKQIARAKYDFDVAGHYARPDVFQLHVDTRARAAVLARD